jgi:hypothetical protein
MTIIIFLSAYYEPDDTLRSCFLPVNSFNLHDKAIGQILLFHFTSEEIEAEIQGYIVTDSCWFLELTIESAML